MHTGRLIETDVGLAGHSCSLGIKSPHLCHVIQIA